MPDGCRDVIWVHRPGVAPNVILSPLDLTARQVHSVVGTTYVGFRLPPAARIVGGSDGPARDDPDGLGQWVADHMVIDVDIEAVLAALSVLGTTVPQAAAHTGLSQRSVERKFRHRALPRPDIWRQMVRARCAAQQVSEPVTFADLAADTGFSDQAHMTRAFRRWFGASPGQIRDDPALHGRISQSGVGNWTAEHSSIT